MLSKTTRCTHRCRCIVDRTMNRRILCGKRCCLPVDHGPSWHHCCADHLKYGGRLSRDAMDSWEVFSWGHRVYQKARRRGTTTCRLVSKWIPVRLIVIGALVALWLAVQPDPSAKPRESRYEYPRLTSPVIHGPEDPSELIGVLQQRQVELTEGYHKRAYVYVGEHPILTTI